jgi:hypothetical protein
LAGLRRLHALKGGLFVVLLWVLQIADGEIAAG